VLDLGFYAVDLIAGSNGFFVLEVNPNPICHFYNADNGRGDFVQIYQYLVQKYLLGE
jgi:glutathione synthase/RimK-type ligase-like ATP-grasp enzyme